MFERITHLIPGNDGYDAIDIEAEIFPGDREGRSSLFIQQPGHMNGTKEIVSVEEWQLDDLIARLIDTRARIREIRAAEEPKA